ncbi:MAG: hypothetical protein JWO13_466 [Acidobacteriales bacterium]|nr:hypothetical protein [Terriglobales bacterium]
MQNSFFTNSTLSEDWRYSSNDPNGFNEFLRTRGHDYRTVEIKKKAELREEYNDWLAGRDRATRELVEKGVQGPERATFLSELPRLPEEFKRIAYEVALAKANPRNRVLTLIALSEESGDFVENALRKVEGGPLTSQFKVWLSRGEKAAYQLEDRTAEVFSNSLSQLFELASVVPRKQRSFFDKLPEERRADLLGLAENIFFSTSAVAFGKFVLFRLGLLIYLLAESSPTRNRAEATVAAVRYPVVALAYSMLDPQKLEQSFHDSLRTKAVDDMFVSAHLDLMRKEHPNLLIRCRTDIEKLAKSRSHLMALAATSALLRIGDRTSKQFDSVLRRAASVDRNGRISEWLSNYESQRDVPFQELKPPFIKRLLVKYVQTSQVQNVSSLIESFISYPDKLVSELFSPLLEASVLLGVSTTKRLVDVLHRKQVSVGVLAQKGEIKKQFAEWFSELFDSDLPSERIRVLAELDLPLESQIVMLEQRIPWKEVNDWKTWTFDEAVPTTIRSTASAGLFFELVTDRQFLRNSAAGLAKATLRNVAEYSTLSESWPTRVREVKMKFASELFSGLAAARTTIAGLRELATHYDSLQVIIEKWVQAAAPAWEAAAIPDVSSIPVEFESEDFLKRLFREQPPYESFLCLFLGKNDWAVRQLFDVKGQWPSPETIWQQISAAHVLWSQRKDVIKARMSAVEGLLLEELGMALRTELGDIESEIAGYYVFRSRLNEIGLQPIEPQLGVPKSAHDMNAIKHRALKDPSRTGTPRIFTHGLTTAERKVIATSLIVRSGDDNDSD